MLPHALGAPCYIVSDLHLGAGDRALERQFVAFLRSLPGRASTLLINGDLFDFWFEWKSVVPRGHHRTLAALADLREAGVEIAMIAGNHDCWGGEQLTEEVGIEYGFGPWSGALAGWSARVEHGDGLRDIEDRRYRVLRSVLRNPAAIIAFRWLHPDWGSRLARGSSDASRIHRARDGGTGLRAVGLHWLAAHRDTDLLVYAHSHVPALVRIPTGAVYANAGSWLDAPTYLAVTPESIALRRWTDGRSAEGELLDVLDRRPEKASADE